MNTTTIDPRINELFSTINNLSHEQNINREAFDDISNTLLSFHDKQIESNIRLVCDSSMGHGKTTVLISYLKWLVKQSVKTPVLIAVKEKQLAHDIYFHLSKIAPKSIINIDSDNKSLFEDDLINYQIVIIQHQRLKNFALGFGEFKKYLYYSTGKIRKGKVNRLIKSKRILIIDEKPEFVDSVIFDINSHHNVLDWFEELSEPLKMGSMKMQRFKHYINFLISEQTYSNNLDKTTALINEEYKNTIATKNLLDILEEIRTHEHNQTKYDSLNKLKHFNNLLTQDNYGRIDDYDYHQSGRKIMIAKTIDYSSLGLNLLIFDGTAKANGFQYLHFGFKIIHLTNRNDYTRLHIQIDNINTTRYSRNKEGKPTQKAISKRIKELQTVHNLFVLPTKDEINTYIETGAILEGYKHYYFDNASEHTKGINILNTTGKNFLKDYNSLYLTCLPKKNADYYKCLAIAYYGTEVNLMMNRESDNNDWFRDPKLDMLYRFDLYAEILQIIHRTALRKIDNKENIYVFIAYDEDKNNDINSLSKNLNDRYLKSNAVLMPHYQVIDMSLYGRDKKIDFFANEIIEQFTLNRVKELKISQVSQTFSNYIRKHWKTKGKEINEQLSSYGLKVIEKQDRYSSNAKYIIEI